MVDGVHVNPLPFIQANTQAAQTAYLSTLSVVAVVNGTKIERSRKLVTSTNFQYTSSVDLSALDVQPGSTIPLTMNLENTAGQSTPFYFGRLTLTGGALRVVLTW